MSKRRVENRVEETTQTSLGDSDSSESDLDGTIMEGERENVNPQVPQVPQSMEMMGMMMEMFRKMSDDAAKREADAAKREAEAAKRETLLLAEIKNLSQGRFEAKQNGEKPPEFNRRWPYAGVKRGCCRLYSVQFNHVGYFFHWIRIRSVSRWLSNSGHNNH